MIYRAAVVRLSDNVVENMVVADDESTAPDGSFLVNVQDVFCDIGWIYDPVSNAFSAPAEEVPA